MVRRLVQIGTGLILGLSLVALVILLTPPPSSVDLAWDGATPPPRPYPAPSLVLEDVDGETVNLASFRGRTTVVFFGYTYCPDVCPATLLNLSGALDRMTARERDRIRVLFVTLDPERDTPERLRGWMENFHPEIVALRGEEEDIWRQVAAWGVHAARVPVTRDPPAEGTGSTDREAHAGHAGHAGEPTPAEDTAEASPQDPHAGHAGHAGHVHDPGPFGLPEGLDAVVFPGAPGAYFVDHSTRSFVLDRQGRIVLFLAPFQGAESMLADLRQVLR